MVYHAIVQLEENTVKNYLNGLIINDYKATISFKMNSGEKFHFDLSKDKITVFSNKNYITVNWNQKKILINLEFVEQILIDE